MPIDKQNTVLNLNPYYDDYSEDKNFHRILFKPATAVQARELTQLQTILQNQIERFGDNIYQTGTIIKGCSLTSDDQYYYAKLFDNQIDGSVYTLSSLVNTFVVDLSTNLTGVVVNQKTGGQQQNPDLNTIYLKYLNTGNSGEKTFSNNATLTFYDRAYRVESIEVNNGGTLYSNNDTVVFIGNTGSGAVATVTTFANGTIRTVNVIENGAGYTSSPSITISSNTGSGANLTAINYLAQVAVANSLYTAPIGTGFAIKTSEGIVYQKGHFIRVPAHEEIVSKYNITPNNVVVGFYTDEAIVNSTADSTLLDNASITTNVNAPGADRLKLTPRLVVLSKEEAAANNDFLSLYEFENGRIVKDRTATQFNSINKELSKRTFEESGNYVVDPIPLYTESIAGNTSHFNLVVGAGLAYVEGNRVQIYNNTKIPVPKSTATSVIEGQSISTSYGGFVYVNEFLGNFDTKIGTQVSLRNAAAADVSDNAGGSPTSPGVQIGTAYIRAIQYDAGIPGSPSGQYRVYLFNVQMATGASFRDVRSISTTGGVCDIVVDSVTNGAMLNDLNDDTLVFGTGTFAVRELTDESFIIRTQTNATFTVTGSQSISFSGGNTLPYPPGSVLNSVEKRDFIVIPTTTITASSNKTGAITINSGSNTIVGTGTLFTTEYRVGQYIRVGTQPPARITAINSNTSISVATNFGATGAAQTHTISYPANVPIDFQTDPTKTISVDASQTTLTLSLGHSITSTAGFVVHHDVRNFEPPVKVKSITTPLFVKLSTASLGSTTRGPWTLGIPDAYKIEGVYVGTSNSYSNTTTNYVNEFVLNNGQTDNFYGLSTLSIKPTSTLSLSNTNCLLVQLKAFTQGTGKYISAESYTSIIDDVTEPLPETKIRTQDIPRYMSPRTGQSIDLRDVIDFRPMAANTAAYANTIAAATIDPSSTLSFGTSEKFFPSPTREFTSTITSYLARKDRVVIDTYGQIQVVPGIPSNTPSVPSEPRGSMTIGIISIAQYPSLPAKEASDSRRPDLGVYVTAIQSRRYTMQDIANIEKRINNLEYYALLNTLEQNTKDLVLPGEANSSVERFKNGFFVDPMTDYNVSNLNDSEYKFLIDTVKGVGRPNFSDTKINLDFLENGSVGVTRTNDVGNAGDLITIDYDERELLSQTLASKTRTLVDQFWKYTGNVKLYPEYDNYYDTTTKAVNISIDIATPLNALAAATSEALSQLNVSTNIDKVVNVGSAFITGTSGWDWVMQQNIERTITDTKVKINPGQELTTVQDLGNYVTDFSLRPYIRPQRVFFYVSGLRPGSQHYIFFDNKNCTNVATQATLTSYTNVNENAFIKTGAYGGGLFSNTSGELAGYVDIPGNTYFVGERSFVIMDVPTTSSETSATSKAVGKFIAYAFGVNKSNLSVSTKTIDVSFGSSFTVSNYTNTYVVSDRIVFTRPMPRPDPICQTFRVQKQLANTDGLFVTGVDLFFQQKDLVNGVTLEVRETVNGVPSHIVVPFSRLHLPSSAVNVSNTAATPTTFAFESPVYLKTETDYAIVVYPDANSPEYRIWTAAVGDTDVLNPDFRYNQNWGLGTLFYSTSGTAWTPVQDEDLKFTLRRAEFKTLSGEATLVNGDYEFLSIANTEGAFTGGEDVAQLGRSYLSGIFTPTVGSTIVPTSASQASALGVGDKVLFIYANNVVQSTGNVNVTSTLVSNGGSQTTDFVTEYTPGDFIRIGNELRQVVQVTNSTAMVIDAPFTTGTSNVVHYRFDPVFDIARVLAANTTTITIDKSPLMSSNNTVIVNAQKAVSGIVDVYDRNNHKLQVAKSNAANSNFKFVAANSTYLGTVVGSTTQTQARVTSVDDVSANILRPLLNTLVVSGTSATLTGTLTKSNGGTETRPYLITSSNKIDINDTAIVKSKSNEIVGTLLSKSLRLNVGLSTSATDTSPVIDINPSGVVLTHNLINNDSTGETGRYGNAACKYISKRLVLADGMDAEDMKLYMTAYKPVGTEIEVYAKILNSTDGEQFDNKDWTQLTQVTSSSIFSDSLDETDYREYEYTFPKTPPSQQLAGFVTTYANTTINGVDTTFTTTLQVGDLVKIVKSNSETDYDILPVTSIGSNTQLTVSSNVSFTGTGNQIEKVTQKNAAFKYTRNSYIVRYFDSTNAAYDTYKYLAIKIVLKSPNDFNVPFINDVRAVACST